MSNGLNNNKWKMLKFYNHAISWNTRRVWITLLEKEIEFEEIRLKLDGEQMQPDFLAINPFHHVPVLVDDDFKVVESLAILDYLEAKYPEPALLPREPQNLAVVRMVEMITVNELVPGIMPLIQQVMGIGEHSEERLEQSRQKIATVLAFFESHLGDNPYFGNTSLSLGDIVAGTLVIRLPSLGITLEEYPQLQGWCHRLSQRSAWQKTEPSPEAIQAFMSTMKKLMKKQQQ